MPTEVRQQSAAPIASPTAAQTAFATAGAVDRSPRLRTDCLSVHYENRSALDDVSLRFFAGQITSLVGPNGAGKSTLLKCLAGMLPPTHGAVWLDNALVTRPSPRVAYVPQRSEVDWQFPITVLDVVLMGRALGGNRLRPIPRGDRQAALSALDDVGLRRSASVQIGALSGGQQQRVFLARAILQQADILLLDEPFSGVDAPTQSLAVSILSALRHRGAAIVFATHDLAMAEQSADACVLLNRRVVADGPPSMVLSVANLQRTFGGVAGILPDPEPRSERR